jgi:phage baseplate assembly protein W
MKERDIRLALGKQAFRPVYSTASRLRRLPRTEGKPRLVEDFDLIEGQDNLGQALVVRLLTPRGELAALGHPQYGSRLHELIGAVNTETTRNLVKLYILEAIARESRVAEVLSLKVSPDPYNKSAVTVDMEVRPTGEQAGLVIGPLTLRLES